MANILILNPNTDTFGRQSIPTALTSALLKSHGHEVLLFDTTFLDLSDLLEKPSTHEDLNLRLNFFKKVDYSTYNLAKQKTDVPKAFEQALADFRPDCILFSFWGSHLHAEGEFHAFFHGRRLLEAVDTRAIPVVAGGTVPTWNPSLALASPKITHVVRGEGELAFLELADRLDAGEEWSDTQNVCFVNDRGELVQNSLRPLIDPLDQLPHADFDIYDDRTFYRPYHGRMVRCVDYELSRGCIFNCSFCLSPFQQRVYGRPKNFRREKSVEKIIDEISFLKKRYRLDIIRYQDETFLSMKPEKLRELSMAYKKHVGLPFVIEATIESITEEKLSYLKEMGCLSMGIGLESGSEYIRKNIIRKPPFTNDDAVRKIKLVKKYDISMNVFNIIGFPEETRERIFETIEVCHRSKPPYCMVSYFQPWEGTALRDMCIDEGLLSNELVGLKNSMDNLLLSSLDKLKIDKVELKKIHDRFVYYVYCSKMLWPFIPHVGGKSLWERLLTFSLTLYLNIRFRSIK